MKKNTRKIIDEMCYCGHEKSKHGGINGHGACHVWNDKNESCKCIQFTWKNFIFDCGEKKKAKSQKAMLRKEFLEHVKLMVAYWASLKLSPEETADGVAFSILVAIDGGACVGPYALIHAESDTDLGMALHEEYSQMETPKLKLKTKEN